MDTHFEVSDPKLYEFVEAFCKELLKVLHGPSEEVRKVKLSDYQARTVYFLGTQRPVYEVAKQWPTGLSRFTITPVIGPFCQVALMVDGIVTVSNLAKRLDEVTGAVNEFLKDVTAKGHWKGDPPLSEWN